MLRWFRRKAPTVDEDTVSIAATKIIQGYGAFLEEHPVGGEIRDEIMLPYPKETILNAIYLALASTTPNGSIREHFFSSGLALASFQKGVGPHTLHPLGIDLTCFDTEEMSGENLARLVLSHPAGKERYDLFRPLVLADINRIAKKLDSATMR